VAGVHPCLFLLECGVHDITHGERATIEAEEPAQKSDTLPGWQGTAPEGLWLRIQWYQRHPAGGHK